MADDFEDGDKKLWVSPTAWAHLLYLCERADTEVGAFGVCGDPDDPLEVTELYVPHQVCTPATVEFTPAGMADMMDDLAGDRGLAPAAFRRVWFHTHPGTSPEPSGVDEATFASDQFSGEPWAIMAILAKGGGTFARIRAGKRPGPVVCRPLQITWAVGRLDHALVFGKYRSEIDALVPAWEKDLGKVVRRKASAPRKGKVTRRPDPAAAPEPEQTALEFWLSPKGQELAARYGRRPDLGGEGPAQADLVPLHDDDAIRELETRARAGRSGGGRNDALPVSSPLVARCEECEELVAALDLSGGECAACRMVDRAQCEMCYLWATVGLFDGRGICLDCQKDQDGFDDAERRRREAAFEEKVEAARELQEERVDELMDGVDLDSGLFAALETFDARDDDEEEGDDPAPARARVRLGGP